MRETPFAEASIDLREQCSMRALTNPYGLITWVLQWSNPESGAHRTPAQPKQPCCALRLLPSARTCTLCG